MFRSCSKQVKGCANDVQLVLHTGTRSADEVWGGDYTGLYCEHHRDQKGIILLVSVAGEKCTIHILTVGAGYILCVPFKRDTSDKEGGMNALLVLPSRTLQTLTSL